MQSCLSEEAVDEISALSAIMGPDCWSDASTPGKLILCVAPEVDDTEVVACVAISVTLPIGYPQDAHAVIEASSVTLHASLFPHRHISAAGSLSAVQEMILRHTFTSSLKLLRLSSGMHSEGVLPAKRLNGWVGIPAFPTACA